MTSQHTELSAIIAVVDTGQRLQQCLDSLRWIDSITVVSPTEDAGLQKCAESQGARYQTSASPSASRLWQAGLEASATSWTLLIRSNEIVTGQLRKSILQAMTSKPSRSARYRLPHTSVYLQKRLKRPLQSPSEPPSTLCFQPAGENALFPDIEEHAFEGELIHYGDATLETAIHNTLNRAQSFADEWHSSNSKQTSKNLVCEGVSATLRSLGNSLLTQKSYKEGFEGAVWTLTEALRTALGFLRYHEQYIRGGESLRRSLPNAKKILIIKLRDIGDNILLSPLFGNLKAAFPQLSQSVLTYDYSSPVFENHPDIERIYGISKTASQEEIRKMIEQLNAEGFDLVVNTHGGRVSSDILNGLDVEHKINNHYIGRNKYYTALTPISDHYRSSTQRDLDCLRVMGVEPTRIKPEIHLSDEEIAWARNELQAMGLDPQKKLIVVHPTAAVAIREWGMDRFGQLIQRLDALEDAQVLAICSPTERPRLDPLLAYSPHLKILHQTSIRQMMAAIHCAALVVDNDSSPSHVAAAFDIPAVVLFSQAIREIFRPYDEAADRHFVFYKDVDCRECGLTTCDDRICMDFTAEEVFHKCRTMLE
ncbi:MAG: hypothetical protein G3M78_07275 [Candidatus Nitrohelix vancouverensis]|uniref:Glycosyltransferase family 9 protein n=1 Tax=Candidatus Nitrohelix vancouverensis TaxID=2705534 RepID=A0A7T0C272_9BACT|nr:MAG: hypothetical protein G3M78_07275 [Candidatus Nitrohelix vancouverensis]